MVSRSACHRDDGPVRRRLATRWPAPRCLVLPALAFSWLTPSFAWPAIAPGAPGPLPVGAQLDPAAAPGDSLAAEVVPDDLQEVVGELDAADQPVPLRDLAAALDPGGAAGAVDALGLSWRSGVAPAGARHDARLELATGPWRARGALRLRPGTDGEWAGAGSLRLGPARLWCGHLALRQGYGLTGGDPGRRQSLAADQGLGGIAGGLVARTASGAAAGGLQAGVELSRRAWSLAGLGGLRGQGAGGPHWALRLAHEDDRRRWSLAAGSDSSATYGSGSGRVAGASFAINWEAAAVADRGGGRTLALVVGAAWRATPRLRLEASSGLADGDGRAATAVLPGTARRGWAARLAWRDRAAGTLEVLAQGSRGPLDRDGAARRVAGVLEAGWERRAPGALTANLRCRRTARGDIGWSEREPWRPGEPAEPLVKTSLEAGLELDDGHRCTALRWRSHTVSGSGNDGNRQLLALSGTRRWPGGREVRLDAAMAWGDAVDLVRALVPLPGLVTARHWGNWRAETMAGAGLRWHGLALRAAVACRLPDAGATAPAGTAAAVWEGWLEARAAW